VSDEKIIVFGGEKLNGEGAIREQLAILDTNMNPYTWSIPSVSAKILPPPLTLHSATLVGNHMFINFGKYLIYYYIQFLN
jgi:hypothetical protein